MTTYSCDHLQLWPLTLLTLTLEKLTLKLWHLKPNRKVWRGSRRKLLAIEGEINDFEHNAAKMMITAELIPLMFFQCSPDFMLVVNHYWNKINTSLLIFTFQTPGRSMLSWNLTTAWVKTPILVYMLFSPPQMVLTRRLNSHRQS